MYALSERHCRSGRYQPRLDFGFPLSSALAVHFIEGMYYAHFGVAHFCFVVFQPNHQAHRASALGSRHRPTAIGPNAARSRPRFPTFPRTFALTQGDRMESTRTRHSIPGKADRASV